MMKESAQTRYLELAARRDSNVLETARRCAELTLPYLLTRSGTAESQTLPETWQSVGAKGVSVMASKLLLAIMPPTTSFFKLQISDGEFVRDPKTNAQIKSEVDLVLSRTERIVLQHINETQDRAKLFSCFKHLVATGNVLVYMQDDADLKLYPINRYVVDRSGGEKLLEALTVEVVNRDTLPPSFHSQDRDGSDRPSGPSTAASTPINENEVEVFTWVKYDPAKKLYKWHQEADDKVIPSTDGQAKEDVCPWLALRFNVVDGEDYGRGRIEEYLGDLRSLESLTQSLVEGAAGSARMVWLVSPACASSPELLAQAPSLSFQVGRKDEVTVVQAGKAADLAVAKDRIEALTASLSEAFLIFTPRQSERTTAEEIRATQQELNEQLGGNLGVLTVDLLQPYLARKMFILRKKRMLPDLPENMVIPTIITGMDGIGRGQDREALIIFARTLQETLGPEAMAQYLKPEELIKRLAASVGIDALGLVKTDKEKQQEKQQAFQQQAALQDKQNEPALAKVAVDAQQLQQNQANAQSTPTASTGGS